jgi:FlaG/FlaF family flagellin (archaellin)
MNQKTIAIAAVLAAALLSGIFSTTPMAAYAEGDHDDDDYDDDGNDNGDYSGTMIEQEIKQSNEGSDSSTNVNCAENDINSQSTFEGQVCGTLDISSIGG